MGPKGHLRSDWHRSGVTSEPPTLLTFHYSKANKHGDGRNQIPRVLCAVLLSVSLDAVNMEIIILGHKAC